MIDSEFHGHTAESKHAAQVTALRARIEDLETQLEVMGAVLEGDHKTKSTTGNDGAGHG